MVPEHQRITLDVQVFDRFVETLDGARDGLQPWLSRRIIHLFHVGDGEERGVPDHFPG